jgi:hypothetical protein
VSEQETRPRRPSHRRLYTAAVAVAAVTMLGAVAFATVGAPGAGGGTVGPAAAAPGTTPEADRDREAEELASSDRDAGGWDAPAPPPPQRWELAAPLDDPIEDGIAAVEARSEEGLAAYRAAVREAAPATHEVPDEFLDDYPETICFVAAEEPGAIEDVLDALRSSGEIDPDLASFLTAAAVASNCPAHLEALPGA